MVSDWAYYVLLFSYVVMAGLNIVIQKGMQELRHKNLKEFDRRLSAETELHCLKRVVGKVSPELLKLHEDMMMETEIEFLSKTGVEKNG